tara:strand:- start:286 stop:576 length:291 start_codon:yes stop_codon:yes gene_type:complete
MARKYTTYSPDLKFRIALEASQNNKTINQIASEYGVHTSQVAEWKKQLLESGIELFSTKRKRKSKNCCEDVDYLQQKIGKLTVEIDWLKKKQGLAC